jgi:Spy/CpxP family protein refolding chaperone
MKRNVWLLSAAAVLALVATAALSAEESKEAVKPAEAKKADEGKTPALEGDLAIMARECKLSGEQQTKLAAMAAEAKAAIEAWEKRNIEKLDAFRKARAAAVEARDEAAMRKAMDEVRPLVEESRKLQTKYQSAIMDLLTPDQKIALQGFVLSMEMSARLKDFNLTAEQTARMRSMCDLAAKDLSVVKGEGEDAVAARQAVLDKLTAAIQEKVFTAEQRAKLAKPADADLPPAEEKKPEGEKKPPVEKKPEAEKAPATPKPEAATK